MLLLFYTCHINFRTRVVAFYFLISLAILCVLADLASRVIQLVNTVVAGVLKFVTPSNFPRQWQTIKVAVQNFNLPKTVPEAIIHPLRDQLDVSKLC